MADPLKWLARRRVTLGFLCGAAALWLARPTWTTWAIRCGIALVGEIVRIWAAGHLEKDRQVTSSGPYRFTGHPLYVGSTIIGIGFAIAASSLIVAALVGLYLPRRWLRPCGASSRSSSARLETVMRRIDRDATSIGPSGSAWNVRAAT